MTQIQANEEREKAKEQVKSMVHDYQATVRYDWGALRLHRDATAESVARAASDLPLKLGVVHGTQEHTVEVDINEFEDPILCSECDEVGQTYYGDEWLCREHGLRRDYQEDGIEGELLDELVERDL